MPNPQKSFRQKPPFSTQEKEQNLRSLMREMRAVLVAYSGGVDSSYLALIAHQELGTKALCVMGISPSVPQIQQAEADGIARQFGFNFQKILTDELENSVYRANPPNRCYFCKTELYGKLLHLAQKKRIPFIVDGTNADDLGDYRPGRQAAQEHAVRSPLAEVGLTKEEIRQLSRQHQLPGWNRPASPCLSSRIAYGVPVTIGRLAKIERGEEILRQMNLREFRVRVHGELARIEIAPDEMRKILNTTTFEQLANEFRKLGFRYVTLDLQGFRSGAMNEVLQTRD